ncbi:MAG TPA: tail fiber domain-containing protein [Bryobacteraceae bacterium]|jgi:hypothetical protein|nr:tail fiber domain-containing protein [Bryobacteraceae bacterium]
MRLPRLAAFAVFLFPLPLVIFGSTVPVLAGNAPVGGGGSCSYSTEPDGTVGQQQAYDDGLYTCLSGSSTWTPEAFMVGSVLQSGSAATCSSPYAGMLQWTGSALQYCNGSSWTNIGTAGGSGITLGTSASATNPQRSGDVTTGLFSPATSAVAISSAGTEMMRVNGAGVGIGTTSPNSTLVVSGSSGYTPGILNVLNTTTSSNGTINGLAPNMSTGNETYIDFGVASTNYNLGGLGFYYAGAGSTGNRIDIGFSGISPTPLSMLGSGNVGIGTTSPGKQLTVYQLDNTSNDSLYVSQIYRDWGSGSSSARGTGLEFRDDNSLQAGIVAVRRNSVGTYQSDLAFQVNSGTGSMTESVALTEAMRINYLGEVGIGTASPANTLDVNGSLAVGTYAGTATGSSNELIVGGNVGIGTTAPGSPLEIDTAQTAGQTNDFLVLNTPDAQYSDAWMAFKNNTNGTVARIGLFEPGATYQGLAFVVGGEGGTSYPTINSSMVPNLYISYQGNVSVNTQSTYTTLTIGGSASVTANNPFRFYAADNTHYGYISNTSSSSAQLDFNFGGAENMTLSSNGNVGIGTTSPGYSLQVNGSTGEVAAFIGNNSNNYISISDNNNSTAATFGAIGGGNAYVFSGSGLYTALYSGNAERIRVNSSGLVGIGTTSPSYTLHVNGSVAGTSAYNNLSDARLKTDIIEITNGLESVQKLKPIHFRWQKPEKRTVGKGMNLPVDEPQVGFLAQDVEKVVPEAVVKDASGLYSMEETKLIPVLVEAVKELEAQNEKLSGQISSMSAQLKQLKETRSAGH